MRPLTAWGNQTKLISEPPESQPLNHGHNKGVARREPEAEDSLASPISEPFRREVQYL